MTKYICTVCGYVYDTEKGLEDGLYAGTAFDDLPENFLCPVCNEPKKYFEDFSVYVFNENGEK